MVGISSELKTRLKTAGFLIAGFASLLLLGSYFQIFAHLIRLVALVVVILCVIEAINVARRVDQTRALTVTLGVVFLLPSLISFSFTYLTPDLGKGSLLTLGLLPMIWFGGFIGLFGREDLFSAGSAFSKYFPLVVLLGLGGVGLITICAGIFNGAILTVHPLIWLILIVVVTDTAAYFVGRWIGGPRLAPAVSPGKTISGSVGGVLAAALTALLLNRIAPITSSGLPIEVCLIVGVIGSISAQLGDLTKSYYKRIFEVKDFGSFLPGHGGVLDRVDGILGAAPFFMAITLWFR